MSFTSGITPVDPSLSQPTTTPVSEALLPASIRNGDSTAKQAYNTALGFEQMLVDQLSQELASTAASPDGSSDGSSDDSSGDSTSGLMGSDPASSIYSQMLPGALTSGIMADGGTGMALELAKALDPAIGSLQTAAASSATQPVTGGSGLAPSATTTVTQPVTGGSAISAASTVASSGGSGLSDPTGVAPTVTHSTSQTGESGDTGDAGEAED
jgi:hypothetical protein